MYYIYIAFFVIQKSLKIPLDTRNIYKKIRPKKRTEEKC